MSGTLGVGIPLSGTYGTFQVSVDLQCLVLGSGAHTTQFNLERTRDKKIQGQNVRKQKFCTPTLKTALYIGPGVLGKQHFSHQVS